MAKQLARRMACLCVAAAIAGAVAGTLLAPPARAMETDAANFVRGLANDAVAVLSDDRLDRVDRAHAFRQLLRRGFDLPAVSRFVLGRYWRRAKNGEREEFVQLFEDYVVVIYGRRLGKRGGKTLTVTGQRADGGDGAIVHSYFETLHGPAIALDWRLKRRAQGWRVIDIMVEGVSLAMTQRSEFASVIRNSGGKVSGLLAKLRQKTQTLASNHKAVGETVDMVSTQ